MCFRCSNYKKVVQEKGKRKEIENREGTTLALLFSGSNKLIPIFLNTYKFNANNKSLLSLPLKLQIHSGWISNYLLGLDPESNVGNVFRWLVGIKNRFYHSYLNILKL